MTDDRTLERAARSWIEVGPTQAPEEAVDAALLRIQTTPQERDLVPWRFPTMTPALRLALLVGATVAVLAGLGLAAGFGQPAPAIAPPSPTPSASPSSDTSTPVVMPDTVRGDWQAETTESIRNVAMAGERIQLSLDWQVGQTAWIQPPRGDNVYVSRSVAAAPGELAFVSDGSLVGCAPGDVGRYAWERSSDGLYLTLTVIEDGCTERAAAFGRTWVHSLSAVTDGGIGVTPFSDRWLQATVPSLRWGLGGDQDAWDLTTFEDGDPDIRFLAIRDPMGISEPCDASRIPIQIDDTLDAFVEYLEGLPGLTVAAEDAVVDGHPAKHVTVASDDGVVDCVLQSTGEVMAFHASDPTATGEWGLHPIGPHTMWIVDVDGVPFLLWYVGDGVELQDAQAVIDSVRFLDALPTP